MIIARSGCWFSGLQSCCSRSLAFGHRLGFGAQIRFKVKGVRVEGIPGSPEYFQLWAKFVNIPLINSWQLQRTVQNNEAKHWLSRIYLVCGYGSSLPSKFAGFNDVWGPCARLANFHAASRVGQGRTGTQILLVPQTQACKQPLAPTCDSQPHMR